MREALGLAADVVFRPRRAADRILERPSLRPAFLIYLAYVAASAAFSAWKPADFPRLEAEALGSAGEAQGLAHWAAVEAVNALLTAAFVALTAWFARSLSGGRLSRRILLCGLLTLVPVGLSLAYLTPPPGTPAWPLGLGWLVLAAALAPGLRSAERGWWPPLGSFLLAMNAAYLAVLPLLAASVLARSETLYLGLARGMAVWMLGLGAYGVSRATGLHTARAFCAVVFALLWQSCWAHALFRLGLMSKDVFKSLMTL